MQQIRWRRARTVAAALTLGLGMIVVAAAPAAAAGPEGGCVFDTSSDGREMGCYNSIDEALKATGAVLDAPKPGDGEAFAARFPAASPAGRQTQLILWVHSIEFTGRDFTGAWRMFVNWRPCTTTIADTEFGFANLHNIGFGDVISSYLTFSNCWVKHFDNINFGGASVGYNGSRAYIGAALDNRTSSLLWS